MRRRPGPLRGVPGPRRRVARGAGGHDVRAHRRERLGQEHAAQVHGPHPAARVRARSRSTARSRPCSSWAPASTPSCRAENVYLNGAILGLGAKDIDRKFDEIVEFAGLEQFIDTPVKNYSSGMYVRLGFSVAINVDPDVLLVDEVLAVGDEEFQRKCNEKFAELRTAEQDHRRRVARRSASCARSATSWPGSSTARSARSGPSGDVIDNYVAEVQTDRQSEGDSEGHGARWGSGEARIDRHRAARRPGPRRPTGSHTGEPVTIRVHYHAERAHRAAGVRPGHPQPRGHARHRAQHP